MMIYADFEYYTTEYLGDAIGEAEFPSLAASASRYIDYYTRDKAKDHADLESVKMCCCALADQYKVIEAANKLAQESLSYASDGAEVHSESVGSWSKSYRSGGDTASAALASVDRSALSEIVKQYLANTGLLYRGGCCC